MYMCCCKDERITATLSIKCDKLQEPILFNVIWINFWYSHFTLVIGTISILISLLTNYKDPQETTFWDAFRTFILFLQVKIGIIGGSGLSNPEILKNGKEVSVDTPYGKVCRCTYYGVWDISLCSLPSFPENKDL